MTSTPGARILLLFLPGLLIAARSHAGGASAPAAGVDPASIVRQAVVHGALGDVKGLERDLDLACMFDRALALEGKQPSGLSEGIRSLLNAEIANSADYVAAQRDALAGYSDAGLRNIVRARIEEDPAVQTRQLLRDASYNRFAYYFNRVARAGAMIAVYAAPAAVNLAIDLATHRDAATSLRPEERKALYLYESRLLRDPSYGDGEDLKTRMARIRRRRFAQLRRIEEQMVKLALREEMPEQALVHAELFEAYGGDAGKAGEMRGSAQSLRRETMSSRSSSNRVQPGAESISDSSEWRRYAELVTLAAMGEPAALGEACASFASSFPRSCVRDTVDYAAAAAAEAVGAHDRAIEQLNAIVERDSETPAARRAGALADHPEYNPKAAFKDALRKHRRDRWGYLFGGQQFLSGTADHIRAQLVLRGAESGPSIGLFYSVGVLARGLRLLLANPVPNSHIIDIGASCLRKYPDAPDSQAMLRKLVREYERARRFDKALLYSRRLRPPDEKRTAYLASQAAAAWMRKAAAESDPRRRVASYLRVLRICPDGPEAKEAVEALIKLRFPEESEWLIPLDFVNGTTTLAAELRRTLGAGSGTEISGDGVYLLPSGCARFVVSAPSGEEKKVQPLPADLFNRSLAVAAEHRRKMEIARSPKGWRSSISRRVFPLDLRGSLGEGGISAYPGLKIREYDFDDATLFGGETP